MNNKFFILELVTIVKDITTSQETERYNKFTTTKSKDMKIRKVYTA